MDSLNERAGNSENSVPQHSSVEAMSLEADCLGLEA